MNKTKAFINTVVILAILFNVAACAILSVDQQNDYHTRAAQLTNDFNALELNHPGDQQVAMYRHQFDHENNMLQQDIDDTEGHLISPNERTIQAAACNQRLNIMTTLLSDATALYPSATQSGSGGDANASSRRPPPPSDDAIAIEAAPANNNTQIIQDMNQGQQGAIMANPGMANPG